jgi:outer membrane receptor protein involved in Fe transport
VVQSSGNSNLSPEVAYTTTVGLVMQPTENFSASLDGYEVRVKGFIPSGANGASGTNQAFQQVCKDSGGTSIYCQLIERSATTGLITKMYSTFINLGEQHTYGVDLETNYRMRLADHPVSLRGLVSYQPHVIYVLPFVDTVDAAGVINGANAGPVGGVVRVSAFARYAVNDRFTVDWLTRWRSNLHHNSDPKQQVQAPYPVSPATAWSNVNLTYKLQIKGVSQADLYFNAQNVFNQLPPPTAFSGAGAEPGLFGGLALGDDVAGRYFTLGVRVRM